MIIIIDGYNLLKQLFGQSVSCAVQQQYLKKLCVYAQKKGHQIIVVFDGYEPYDYAVYKGITVVYSKKRSADAYIMDYIQLYKGRDLLFITRDREIVSCVESHQYVAVAGDIFNTFITSFFNEQENKQVRYDFSVQRYTHCEDVDDELDRLMMAYVPEYDEKDREELQLKQNKNRLNKKERALERQLKKL